MPVSRSVLSAATSLFLVSVAIFAQASLVGIPDGPNTALPTDPMNQDRAKFMVASFDDVLGREWIYFAPQNERILLNVRNPDGSWVYEPSRVVLQGPPGSTAGIGAVLSNDSPIYHNVRDGADYKYVMYMGYQLAGAGNAGGACVSFSNNGIDWTVPIGLSTGSTPLKDCSEGSDIHLESLSAFHISSTEIEVFGLEGDLNLLQDQLGQARTLTYFYKSFSWNPHRLSLVGELSVLGLFTPTIAGGPQTSYIINLDATYDPVSGDVYLFRVYPYPFRPVTDPSDPNRVPCSGVCPYGLTTYPMRGQIYYMHTGGNTSLVTSGAWTLLVDGGGSTGWSARSCPSCSCTPFSLVDLRQRIIGPATNGYDLDSLSVKKTRNGQLLRVGSQMTTFFGGFVDRQESCDFYSSTFETFLDAKLYRVNVNLP